MSVCDVMKPSNEVLNGTVDLVSKHVIGLLLALLCFTCHYRSIRHARGWHNGGSKGRTMVVGKETTVEEKYWAGFALIPVARWQKLVVMVS